MVVGVVVFASALFLPFAVGHFALFVVADVETFTAVESIAFDAFYGGQDFGHRFGDGAKASGGFVFCKRCADGGGQGV